MTHVNDSSTWTEKHRDFAISLDLPQSSIWLWEYLLDEGLMGSEIVDLRDFNKWIAKRRGRPYDRRTIKSAANRLEEAGVLVRENCFTEFVRKYIIKPLGALFKPVLKQDKRCKSGATNATLGASNAPNFDARTNNSNRISKLTTDQEQILEECEKAGMEFKAETKPKILDFPLEQVLVALAFWGFSYPDDKSKAKVRKPEGWLIDCLEQGWWQSSSRFLGHLCAYDILPLEVLEACFGDYFLQ